MQNNDLQMQERVREEAQARVTERELRDALQDAKEKAKKVKQDAKTFHVQL